jgi:hypothetical protein
MPRVGFEPTITVFERAKTFHALDGAATVIGLVYIKNYKHTDSVKLWYYIMQV